jgi:L-gulonolactone oxidase
MSDAAPQLQLRFGHPREEYLHMAYGMQRPVYVQSTWLRSRGNTNAAMRFGWVTDLLEELTLCKYEGRPHW